MNTKLFISAAVFALLGLNGCAHHQEPVPASTMSVQIPQTETICQQTPDGGCYEDPFVNYTRTAADFRAYGERTPRDQFISQSGAGNNMSAVIMPSVEDEVVNYQEQVTLQEKPAEPIVEEPVTAAEKPAEEPVAETTAQEPAVAEETVVEEVITPEAEEVAQTEETIMDEDPVQDWLAEEGQNLKALLTEWSDKSGWRLVWNTNRNYVLNAGAMFRGRFADVSAALIRAFARARPAPIATYYKGNRVLVVETMEDENAYD